MPYVTIEVLQEDIDRALRDRRLRARPDRFCPVARAACRTLGLALGNIRIGGNTISIWGWEGYEYLDVTATKKLEQAVTRFDREQQMKPGGFRLNLTPLPVQGGQDMQPRIAIFVRGGVVQEVASDTADVLIKLLDMDSIDEGEPPDEWRPPDVVIADPRDFEAYTSGRQPP